MRMKSNIIYTNYKCKYNLKIQKKQSLYFKKKEMSIYINERQF